MAYTSNKAPKRANPTNPKDVLQKDAKASGKASNQEQFTDRGVRNVGTSTSDYSGARYADVDREVGNQVRIAQNDKGTGTVKNPLNAYRSITYPAVQNPDPVKNRSGVNKAPGRRRPNDGPTT